jgi:hypothetical protein
LPVDERPVPGKAELYIEADPGSDDFVTEDGWRIRYDEAYASLGNVRLEPLEDDAECEQYASTPYLRVVDLLDGRSRLVTLFARGPCTLRFQLEGPGELEIVSGVDESIVEAMRQYDSDPFVVDQSVVLRVAGSAERDRQRIRFEWRFRQSFDYDPCATAQLTPAQAETIDVRARLSALFADPSDASLRFDALAAADRDADGELTLEELSEHDRTLGEHLYFNALPQLFWIGDEPPCFAGRFMSHPD